MAKTKSVERDTRDYDTTQLHANGHGKSLHRDYSAHFFRWSFARRMIKITDHVLEIGCGEDKPLSKILTGGAAARVESYTGVDLNKLKTSESQRLTFIGEFNFVERWQELKKFMPKSGFNVVVHFEVIEHMKVEHGKKMLAACHQLLAKNGLMLMSTPCYDGKRHAANHIHEYTVPELTAIVQKAGFTVEKRFGTFMDIKYIGKPGARGSLDGDADIMKVRNMLSEYFDNDAISNIFGPLYPDNARNNLWVCRKK